ncbi:prepilin peptidase [Magnetofaba australis]|uniref:Prepilin leader peptidase/N-methyltransferase n=1 Tax=Magnetofaba australis IT-1 TaxID=1434232 RepID=A0A1Y2K2D4_9PROT|nr:A24 family peptidase [Magnetofaba australis]OSM00481.1 putative type 4 prepilin peptidase 1 [Magnetofaba australis IT-1]
MDPVVALFVFVLGAVIGSFLNVCIHRLPNEESIIFPSSHCPHCKTPIKFQHNVPLLGWLMLKGRCAKCAERISIRYPLVELTGGLCALFSLYHFGLTVEMALVATLGMALITLSMIDFDHYILPDVITLPGIVAGLIISVIPAVGEPFPHWRDAVIGVVAGGGGLWLFAWLFEKITGRVGMGFGDVKLVAMLGAWLGWEGLPFTIFGAALIGSIVGIIWLTATKRGREHPIPFGPYLAVMGWIYLFYGCFGSVGK